MHSIVTNHALVDGNKRLGFAALLVFAGVNGRRLAWTNAEAYDVIIAIAEGGLRDVGAIAAVIADGLKPD